jgi:hypothetical protein
MFLAYTVKQPNLSSYCAAYAFLCSRRPAISVSAYAWCAVFPHYGGCWRDTWEH